MVLEKLKKQIAGILNKHPIAKSALFGSYARGEENKSSDIDILIETSKPISLFVILKIEKELRQITKKKIDIIEYSAIKPFLRENVLSDAISILWKKRDDKVYLNDILESINTIENFISDKTEFEFSSSRLIQDAVIRRFEIIGEGQDILYTF